MVAGFFLPRARSPIVVFTKGSAARQLWRGWFGGLGAVAFELLERIGQGPPGACRDPGTRATAIRNALAGLGNSGFTMSNSGKLLTASLILIIGFLSPNDKPACVSTVRRLSRPFGPIFSTISPVCLNHAWLRHGADNGLEIQPRDFCAKSFLHGRASVDGASGTFSSRRQSLHARGKMQSLGLRLKN